MQRLVDLQVRIAKGLCALCVIHVPILVLIAAVLTRDVGMTAVFGSLFAGLPLVFFAVHRPIRMTGFALAICLVAQTGLLVDLLAQTAWQVEMHFYFFATLAMLAGFCDLPILIGGAVFITIHHLLLNAWLPNALFAGGTDYQRIVIHALVVVIETAVLAYISRQIVVAFRDADDAEHVADDASARAARAGRLIEQKLGTETARANHLARSLDFFRADISERLRILGNASRSLYATADELLQAAAHTKSRTETARLAAGEATTNADLVAASGGELFGMITDIAHQATQSAAMGASAVVDTATTVETIDELTQMSTQIEAIVNLIARVAGQTNLLALNATIEASRAGEHGRGFAVVAQEVKLLASKTSESVQSIGAMVAGIRSTAMKSVDAIDGVTRSIKGLNDATALIAEAAEERVAAAAAMTRDISRAASDVNIVCTAIGEIERVADETTQGANMLRRAAQDIADNVDAIEREVERYAADHRRQTQLALGTLTPNLDITA